MSIKKISFTLSGIEPATVRLVNSGGSSSSGNRNDTLRGLDENGYEHLLSIK
jgi:hypothetical protein